MKIEVEGKHLVNLFHDFVKNTKVMFNFKTDGKCLDVQMIGDYTACTTIPVKSLDNDFSVTDASLWVTKAVGVMDKDKPITILFSDAVVFMEQETFSSTFVKEHEERRTYPDPTSFECKPAYANRLKYLAHCAASCIGLSKELSIADPDPVFYNGKFYVDYRQTFLIDSIDYPEMCIPLSILRDFAYKLDEKATYTYLSDLSTVYFKSKDYDFWVPTSNYNIRNSIVSAIDVKMNECTHVTDLCFMDYVDKLSIISGAFPKQKMALLIGDGVFSVSITNNDVQCTVGAKMNNSIVGINVTSAQVAAIAKLFKDDEQVECLRGGNCICLRSGERNMLIAGMIY